MEPERRRGVSGYRQCGQTATIHVKAGAFEMLMGPENLRQGRDKSCLVQISGPEEFVIWWAEKLISLLYMVWGGEGSF